MISLDTLKQQIKQDFIHFKNSFRLDNWFRMSWFVKWTFILLFVPYYLFIWIFIVVYKYCFIYIFLIIDLIIFSFFAKSNTSLFIYGWFKTISFWIFYDPFFVYLPRFRIWLRSFFTFGNFKRIGENFLIKLITPFLFIYYRTLLFIWALINFDIILWWSSIKHRYNRYLWMRHEAKVKKTKAEAKEQKLISYTRVLKWLHLRAYYQILLCRLKHWFLLKNEIFYYIYFFFQDKIWFVYKNFFWYYWKCRYTWEFRYAYWSILKRYCSNYIRVWSWIIKIEIWYLGYSLYNIFFLKVNISKIYFTYYLSLVEFYSHILAKRLCYLFLLFEEKTRIVRRICLKLLFLVLKNLCIYSLKILNLCIWFFYSFIFLFIIYICISVNFF